MKDLRSFLQQLVAHDPDQLVVVDREVAPVFEPTAIVDRLRSDPRYPTFPAVLFKRVRGSPFGLLLNLHGTYDRLALSLDATMHTMAEEFSRREKRPGTLRRVERSAAPVKEVVWAGDQVDLTRLPLLQHLELDAGKMITSAVSFTRDAETGAVNASVIRHQVFGKRELGFHPSQASNTGYILWQHQQRKQPLQVALAIGHHPALLLGAVSRPPGVGGELEVASGLLQQRLEVVPAETLDLDVPARAEFVLEGVVDTNPETYRQEGPCGEYPGYYTGSGPEAVLTVTAMTMRRNPIYVDVFNAHDEHLVLGGLTNMGRLLSRIREVLPTVTAINLPLSGGARTHAYIAMRKRVDGEPHQAAYAAFANEPILKHVFIVDDDIDVYDEQQVLWALATRFQADKDLTVIRNSLGGRLSPVAYGYRRDEKGALDTKLIFDCTKPAPPARFPSACRVSPQVAQRMDPDEYVRPLAQ
ncbi:MAG: UbiD family decarboxylase [Chloroflexi bacterium]|nr:UbiD family decarboxylase [Chloroflexota bacterium]